MEIYEGSITLKDKINEQNVGDMAISAKDNVVNGALWAGD